MARILIAEDEEGLRSLVARALMLDGHDVITANDGAEALELIVYSRAAFPGSGKRGDRRLPWEGALTAGCIERTGAALAARPVSLRYRRAPLGGLIRARRSTASRCSQARVAAGSSRRSACEALPE